MLTPYFASVDNHGSVSGYFLGGLRRCDRPFFRNTCIVLATALLSRARTSTEMLAAFLAIRKLGDMNVIVKVLVFIDKDTGHVGLGEPQIAVFFYCRYPKSPAYVLRFGWRSRGSQIRLFCY